MRLDSKNKLFILLILISSLTILPFLDNISFHTKGEPREAIVGYTMLSTGNWILPINNGGDIAYKPPFFHWSIAALSMPGGEVTEFTARLPSALALIIMAGACFLFFAKRVNARTSFIAMLLMLSCFEVHRAGMTSRVDMVMTSLIVLALLQLYQWTERGMKGFPVIATLLMGMATLTKGPVGIILPCAVAGVYLLVRGVPFIKAFSKLFLIGLVSVVLPGIWYYMAYLQGGDNFINLIMEENFGRFFGKMSYESHEQPAIYNFYMLLAGYMPWTLPVLFSLFVIKFKKVETPVSFWMRNQWSKIKNMDSAKLYSLISIVIIFVFYCIPKSKRTVYLLPVYPFIALFLADFFISLADKKRNVFKWLGGFLSVIAILLTSIVLIAKFGLIPFSVMKFKAMEKAAVYIQSFHDLSFNPLNILYILLPVIMAVVVIYYMRKKMPGIRMTYAVIAMFFSIQLSLDAVALPVVLNQKSIKSFALEVGRIVPEGKIYGYISGPMMRFFIINFYNHNRVVEFETEKPTDGYLLLGKNDVESFITKYSPDYTFTEVMHTANKDNDIRDIIYLFQFKKK